MYNARQSYTRPRRSPFKGVMKLLVVALLAAGAYLGYMQFFGKLTPQEAIDKYLTFDATVSEGEQTSIKEKLLEQKIALDAPLKVGIETTGASDGQVSSILVPVTSFNSIRQSITTAELANKKLYVMKDTSPVITAGLATFANTDQKNILEIDELSAIPDEAIAFIQAPDLDYTVKLLRFNDAYYLDSFTSGALYRTYKYEGSDAQLLADFSFTSPLTKDSVFKVNMTGVTALTRLMMRKLPEVKDATYFSEKIGDFLADADLTHVSNEVSFKPDCGYSNALFCSPPEFIETLKDSGVDLVELTGNHNNDLGAQYNTDTINLYKSLGWGTYGGGLNTAEAAKPFISEQKGSKVTFLAYNYPDAPNGGAIAGSNKAGANAYTVDKAEADIKAAKEASQFVIVNVQYWECYAYPEGYLEFPECDKPIGEQASVFKELIDMGADMVIGSSAHQPQTYELYKNKPIYYGLGNMYFEQINWPGTERGLILTHYFDNGRLLQTRISPTVYDRTFQTRLMDAEEAEYLLTRLYNAR